MRADPRIAAAAALASLVAVASVAAAVLSPAVPVRVILLTGLLALAGAATLTTAVVRRPGAPARAATPETGTGEAGSEGPGTDAATRYAAIGALTEQYAQALNAPLGTLVSAISYAESVNGRLAETVRDHPEAMSLAADLAEALRLARAATAQSRELSLEVREIVERDHFGPPVQVDVARVAASVIERLDTLVPGLEARVQIISLQDGTIALHASLLELVLDQLVRNALVHGFDVPIPERPPARGTQPAKELDRATIQIAVGPIDASRPRAVTVRLWNNGRAISPDTRSAMFRPFSPAAAGAPDGSGRATGGRGVGLFTASYLVQTVARGSLELDEASGEGVGFTLRLPEADAP